MPGTPVSPDIPLIVVLDGFTLNPGDLDWAPLRALGECRIYDRTAAGEVIERADGAAVILTNKTPVNADALGRLPALRCIGVLATGYNIVDVGAARDHGIVVTNVPAYSTESVAQLVFAHLLNLMEGVEHHARTVRQGRWSASPDFSYWDWPLRELAGLTIGIVGYGRIGRAVARIAGAFGMHVIAADRAGVRMHRGVPLVPLDELFRLSDVISLHCPLTPETLGMVDARRLALMKPGAVLINTSRGPLVDEAALAAALQQGRIAGAGLDVLAVEPPEPGNPLLSAPHCAITPHIGWATVAARRRLLTAAVDNVTMFLAGTPKNAVS